MRGHRSLVRIEIRAPRERPLNQFAEKGSLKSGTAKEGIMVRVGLIGFGLAGQAFHAPVIRGVPGMELACILERHGSNAKAKYPEVRIARTLDELLSDKSIGLMRRRHAERFALFLHQSLPRSRSRRSRRQTLHSDSRGSRTTRPHRRRAWPPGHGLSGPPLGRRVPHREELVKSGALGAVVEYEARFDRFRLESKPGAWRERARSSCSRRAMGSRSAPDRSSFSFVRRRRNRSARRHSASAKTSQIDDSFDVIMEYPQSACEVARAHHRLRSGPAPADSRHGGSFIKYGMDPQEEILRSPNLP